MDGIAAFKRIFTFLIAQIVLLITAASYLTYIAMHHAGRPDMAVAAATALIFAAIALLVMRYAWPIGITGVELFWGTSVKQHVERLMLPALAFGAGAMFLTAGAFALAGRTTIARVVEALLAASAIGVPLIVSLLLIVSATRRLRAYRKGHAMMEAKLEQMPELERVSVSIASEEGSTDTTVRPDPQGFTFAGLTSKPWYAASDFPWVAAFEEAVDEITAEYEALRQQHADGIKAYSYAGLEGDFWQSFQFVTRHRELPERTALCPKTAALLKTIPHYPAFRDAMFSILEGGGVISPHRDVSNVFLTMHLPLIVPGNGFMEVGGLKREWKRGEAMIFDSSYHHQAQNNSNEDRVVLLVDFLHPDLTDEEAQWVHASRL